METPDARKAAEEQELDLVEVAPNADPPVCRIMNFGKYKYEQQKKQHQAKRKSHGVEMKELRLGRSIRIESHDLEFKEKKARELLDKGHRVQVFLQLRGREMAHAEMGVQILADMGESLEDIAKIDEPPRIMGRRILMLLTPLSSSAKKRRKEAARRAAEEARKEAEAEATEATDSDASGAEEKAPGDGTPVAAEDADQQA